MNKNIAEAVGKIVAEVTANMKPVLTTFPDPIKKETVEITIDKKARVFVHSQGIKVTADTNNNNTGLGLNPLSSDKNRCKLDLSFDEAQKAGDILSKLK